MRDDDKAFYRTAVIAALLILVWKGMGAPLSAQSVESPDTAKGRAIVARHVAAVGGEAAFRARPTHIRMTMQMHGSAAVIKMESWRDGPRFYGTTVTPGVGTMEMGSDGKTAWMITPQLGAMLLGELPSDMSNPADVAAELHKHPVRYVGVREMAGKKYDVVELVVGDTLRTTAYFDPSSGLMAGMTPAKPPGPPGQMAMSFDEWRRFGPGRYATRMRVRTPDGKEIVMQVDGMSHHPIGPALFQLPARVQALQNRKP